MVSGNGRPTLIKQGTRGEHSTHTIPEDGCASVPAYFSPPEGCSKPDALVCIGICIKCMAEKFGTGATRMLTKVSIHEKSSMHKYQLHMNRIM